MTKPDASRPQTAPTSDLVEQRDRAASLRDTAGRFAKRAPKADVAPQPPTAESPPQDGPTREAEPRRTVPALVGSPAGTYALRVDEGGLGLHAAPGASILAAPIMPTGAGLAVFYLKGAPGPAIYDLTHGFDPRHAQPVAPTSTAIPLIDVVNPVTGQFGRIDADRIAALHRVVGIYTPAEIGLEHRPAPAKLPVMTACPEGMGEIEVRNASPYPMARPGETLIYDPAQREPTNGALCVVEWKGGHRSVLLTNLRKAGGSGEDRWWTDPVNRPSSRTMLDRRLKQGMAGGLMFASEGPFTEERLREVIVGRVVGVLVPWHRESGETIAQPVAVPEPPRIDRAAEIQAERERQRAESAASALDDAGLTSAVSPELRAAIVRHGEVMHATREPAHDNAEFDRQADMQIEAEAAVANTPAATLADVRAKLAYLLPIIEPDMLDPSHADHLRAILGDVDRLCRLTPANDDGADPVFAAITAHVAAWGAFGLTCNPIDRAWRRQQGLDMSDEAMAPAQAAWEAANAAEVSAWNAVFETRPTTLPGFVAVVRHAGRWAGDHIGMGDALEADDILARIAADAERVLRAALDGRTGLRPDLSRVPTSELAVMPFEPVDRDSPCPVPTREDWLRDADTILPWLRMGWVYLTLDRDALADAMLDETDEHFTGFMDALGRAERNFEQLTRFARAVLDRRMIGTAALAVREGVEG